MPTAGASITIADSAGTGFGVAWLEDGTLVFPTTSLLGLRRVSESGGPVTVIIADSVFKGLAPMLPTPLPHGRGILFGVCASGCVIMELHVLDFRTGKEKLLVKDVGMGWYLPTGHLFYVRRDGVAVAVPFDLGKLETHGAAIPVLQGVGLSLAAAELAWSPSGGLVYGNGITGNDIVTLQRADRSGKTLGIRPRRGAGNSIRSPWPRTGGARQSAPKRRAVGSTSGSSSLNGAPLVESRSADGIAVQHGRPTDNRSPSYATAAAAATSTPGPSMAAARSAASPTSVGRFRRFSGHMTATGSWYARRPALLGTAISSP